MKTGKTSDEKQRSIDHVSGFPWWKLEYFNADPGTILFWVFGGIHLLPPFPSTGDRGFAPVTYREIDPKLGTWQDIQKLSATHDVLLDFMVNHISRHSSYFQDFVKNGRQSQYADLFITLDKVWPDGKPVETDVRKSSCDDLRIHFWM